MHVFQTAGVPPRRGKTILANIGWTENKRKALRNRVLTNNGTSHQPKTAFFIIDLLPS
jgi:hypothetical protein